MPNFNQVNLIGNITRDIETRYTPQGTAIVDVGLAINRSWKNDQGQKQEETTFVDVTLWARMAEIAAQYCHKGDPLFVSGRLHLDTWDDKQTGQKRSKLKVIGESIQLLGARQQANTTSPAGNQPPQRQAAAPQSKPVAAGKSRPAPDPDLDAEPSDIPF
jgi:single-strand DNA-binding protein